MDSLHGEAGGFRPFDDVSGFLAIFGNSYMWTYSLSINFHGNLKTNRIVTPLKDHTAKKASDQDVLSTKKKII